MKKSYLVSCIIFLLILSIFTQMASSIKSQKSNIIYVDDDNINGPWDGSEEYPYQKICDGINASNNDDTVFVKNGIYDDYEIHIDTSIYLKGEHKRYTVIEEGQIIWMTSSKSTVSGFNLTNCFIYSENQDYVEIYNNYITGGVIIDNTIDSYIHNNSIFCSNEVEPGIRIIDGCQAIIEFNIISNITVGGIAIFGNANIISNNTILNFDDNEVYGIYLEGHNNIIIHNHIESCFFGIKINYAYGNKIKRNNFIDNTIQIYSFGILDALGKPKNIWDNNYWNRPRILPKIILGFDFLPYPGSGDLIFWIPVPIIQIDWHPSIKPFYINS